MRVIILASGITKPEYFLHIVIPKCLLPLKDEKTILDLQMKRLAKIDADVTIVVGYKGDEVIVYCDKMHYNVNFVWDTGWADRYSLTRLMVDLEHIFNTDFILLFGDTMFDDDMLEWLVNCTADLGRTTNDNVFRFSKLGAETIIQAFKDHPEFDGLNSPLFFAVEDKIRIETSSPFWKFDVDRIEELRTARDMAVSRL